MDFVIGKASWIIKNIGYFKTSQPEQTAIKKYLSREIFKYLGRQYRLKVETTTEILSRLYLFIIYYINSQNKVKPRS